MQPYDSEVTLVPSIPQLSCAHLALTPGVPAIPQPSRSRPADGRYGENPNRLALTISSGLAQASSPADSRISILAHLHNGLDQKTMTFTLVSWEAFASAWGLGTGGLAQWHGGQFTYFSR